MKKIVTETIKEVLLALELKVKSIEFRNKIPSLTFRVEAIGWL
jgi:hypothetical protein